VRVRNTADERQQHADGVLGGRHHVAVRRVANEDAAPRTGFDVDVVDADAGASDDAQPGSMLEKVAVTAVPDRVIRPS